MSDFPNILDTPLSAGGLTLLDTQSGLNVSNLDITDIPQSYTYIELVLDPISNINANADLSLLVSINNGTSFLNTLYSWGITGRNQNGSVSASSTDQGGTAFPLHNPAASFSANSVYGTKFTILNYNDAAGDGYIKAFWESQHKQSGGFQVEFGQGLLNVASGVNAIRLVASDGNINATMKLYGIT